MRQPMVLPPQLLLLYLQRPLLPLHLLPPQLLLHNPEVLLPVLLLPLPLLLEGPQDGHEAEDAQLHHPGVIDQEQVLALQVALQEPMVVHILQGEVQLREQLHDATLRQRGVLLAEAHVQVPELGILRHDHDETVVLKGIHHAHDVGMQQLP